MTEEAFAIKAKVWLHSTPAATWHLVSIPLKESSYIQERFGSRKRGFGSIRVKATIGIVVWNSSIFPDSRNKGTYFLLLKAEVRQKASIAAGDTIEFTIEI